MLAAPVRRITGDDRLMRRFLVAAMALGLAGLVAVAVAAWWATGETRRHGGWVSHTYQVELAVRTAGLIVEQGETTRRGYMLTGRSTYADHYRRYRAALGPALDRLGRLTGDNPRQAAALARLRPLIGEVVALRDGSVALVAAGQLDRARAQFLGETSARRMLGIRALFAAMAAEEQRLLATRDAQLRASQQLFTRVLVAAGALIAFVALASLAAVLRYTRDLGASAAALRRFNETLEDQVAERTMDLRRANDEIQRFAYIVSHDLRSPLVNVMGFTAELADAARPLATLVDRVEAEAPSLLTADARVAAREDLPEAIGFIRTSTEKMDRLINAILKLSREGRRVLAPEPLDLAGITDGAVAAIQHLIDARGAAVSVERPMPGIVSDRLAVEQILSNLVENATKYLQPGRPGRIAVTATRSPGRVVVSVADNGRGIDPRDHGRIFDLFRRSGAQDQPGEGIGLAHVRALAYRLGGTIDVQSVLGEGATFRLSLPVHFQPTQDTAP